MDELITIRSAAELEAALNGKPQGWADVIALRAALRVVPAWYAIGLDLTDRSILISLFRNLAVVRLNVIGLENKKDKYHRSRVAYNSRAKAASNSSYAYYYSNAYADATAFSVMNADLAAVFEAYLASISNTARICAKNAGFGYFEAPALVDEATDLGCSLISADLNELVSERSPYTLLLEPLGSIELFWASIKPESPIVEDSKTDIFSPIWLSALKLLHREDHNWQVWTDWWEAMRDGRAPWGLPREVGDQLTLDFVTWPEAKWQRPAADINAEIAAMIEAVRAAQTLLGQEGEPLGRRWTLGDKYFELESAGDNSDEAAASNEDVIRRHDELRRLAAAFVTKKTRLSELGRSELSATAEALAASMDCAPDLLPIRVKQIYDCSVSFASYLEEDEDLRRGNFSPSSNLRCLPADLRREFVEIIRRLGPWIRSFPTARREDDELGGFLAKPDLYEPTRAFVIQAEAGHLIRLQDRDLILRLLAALERPGGVADKAAKRGFLTGKNLVVALTSVLGTLLLNGYANESPLVKRTSKWLVDNIEGPIQPLIESMAPDVQQAVRIAIDDAKSAGFPEPPDSGRMTERHAMPTRWSAGKLDEEE